LFTRISDDLQQRKDTGKQLETLLADYVDALTTNIKEHLGNSPNVIQAYAIFDPILLPSNDKVPLCKSLSMLQKVSSAMKLSNQQWPTG